ncbi:MAG: type IV secretory system conjugative DNA transfer family protein [Candidatus Acidulodesulfobacterium acidiphilum]|uniref:Type IV secretory system conjugative DNA transfer family protein n=1 Tax=Candidatus Acidulodesulfobacterium acidiphilum TaxID=2597224 RepID=A0A520XFB4_9DELT|nr:MAG: type IV secretory system conjugative DNA transfer family protein [Candidatus Acidulodesulfobacterium acidiphilum]
MAREGIIKKGGNEEKTWAFAKDMMSEKRYEISIPRKGHMVAFGITGSGKTESVLLPFWEQTKSMTTIDGKGDSLAKSAARILNPDANIYDFDSEFNILDGLKKNEIVELFRNAFYPRIVSTQETFYQNFALTAVTFVLNFMEDVTFEKIFISLFRENIKKLYDNYHDNLSEAEDLIFQGVINNADYASYISSLMNQLQPFALKKNLNVNKNNLNLKENNWFSFRNIETENTLGRTVIECIRLKKPHQRDFQMTLCIDEFSDLAYSYFSKFIKEIRGFGIQALLLTQSLADVIRTDETLLNIILDNTDLKLFFAQDGLYNEKIAQLFGQEIKSMKSEAFTVAAGETIVSSSEHKDYLVQPSAISELRTGNAIAKIKIEGNLKKFLMSFNHIDINKVLNDV